MGTIMPLYHLTSPRSRTRKPAKTPPNPTLMAHRALKAHTSTRSPTKQPGTGVLYVVVERAFGERVTDGVSDLSKFDFSNWPI
jgi:hypothetical protein